MPDLEWKPEKRKLSDLKHWDGNPRVIREPNFKKLKDRISKRGFHDVLKVSGDEVISGNQRMEALKQLGYDEVTVLVPSRALTDDEKATVALESNWSDGEHDFDKLFAMPEGLLREVGWDDKAIQKLIDGHTEAKEDDYDVDEGLKAEPRVKIGEIWQLGNHFLMCGDSTKREDVERLMDGKKADMVFTDPPWNVAIGLDSNPRHRQREGLMNDNLGDGFPDFLSKFCPLLSEYCDGDIYCVMGCEEWPNVHRALTDAGLHWSSTIVWVKDVFVLGRSKYHRRYEPIWYGWRDKSSYQADRKQDDVWEIPRPKRSVEHPTMKPIELVVKAIKNSGTGIVMDLFLGSGSTLIACEQTKRTCYGMEIDPHYCTVILDRWSKLTGKEPVKVG